jgi:hypothetical protein
MSSKGKSKALTNFASSGGREVGTYLAKKLGADSKTVKQIGDLSAKAGSYLRSFIPFEAGGKVRTAPMVRVSGYVKGGVVVLRTVKAPKKAPKRKGKK